MASSVGFRYPLAVELRAVQAIPVVLTYCERTATPTPQILAAAVTGIWMVFPVTAMLTIPRCWVLPLPVGAKENAVALLIARGRGLT